MQEIICYSDYLPEGTEQTVSFIQLLLDDNWAKGELLFSETVYSEIGGKNTRLTAGQNYEFLLRAVQKYPLKVIGRKNACSEVYEEKGSSEWEEFRTDCYVTGRYIQELQDSGNFNLVLETLLSSASGMPDPDAAVAWLEKMLAHSPEYCAIDADTCPILIYKGSPVCYNLLNVFAEELAQALTACRQKVMIFDPKQQEQRTLAEYAGRRFKAVIGIQTYGFHVVTEHNVNFHDLFSGPKFSMILDHPGYLPPLASSVPRDFYLLIHDRNYMNFVKKYYKNVAGAFRFAPAGMLPEKEDVTKLYDISFIGSYHNYRDCFYRIKSFSSELRPLALRYLAKLKEDPDLPAEKALEEILGGSIQEKDIDFPDLFFRLKDVNICALCYYKEKVITTLLKAGFEVHVYGASWDTAPFSNHPRLFRHPQVTPQESLLVMQQSRISLNIMTGHKDGFTERIANALLCKSVVLSDRTTALEENFLNGEELILFELKETDALPAIVDNLLKDPERLQSIAEKGYLKAREEHLWLNRARQLLSILSGDII